MKVINLFKALPALLILSLISCNDVPVPKPRGFQRIDLPARTYHNFKSGCSFSIDVPDYSIAFRDSAPYAEPCWFNVYFPEFNATLHLSYIEVKNKLRLNQLIEDSRMLVYKHTIKADEIYETLISNDKLNGMLYDISGNTATNFQFYVTDSTSHFLRGSLYFNVKTNPDSISPVLHFVEGDILHMLETLKWE